MQLVQNAPSLEQFVKGFVVANKGASAELLDQPLYDRIVYPTAGVAGNLSFFTTPIGSGQSSESGAAANTAKSIVDTNMTQQGQLPAPQAFWVKNVQVDVDPGSVNTATLFATQPPTFFNATAAATVQAGANDKNAILNSGALLLSVGTKPYLQGASLKRFPPITRLRADTSTGLAGTNAQPGAMGLQYVYADCADPSGVAALDPGFSIPTSMNFVCNLFWPAAIATASGFNARIRVELGGWLIRAIQ